MDNVAHNNYIQTQRDLLIMGGIECRVYHFVAQHISSTYVGALAIYPIEGY